jgi:hypothetical protein
LSFGVYGVWIVAWIAAVLTSAVGVVVLQRTPRAAVALAIASLALAAAMLTVNWFDLFANTWLRLNRGAFLRAEEVATSATATDPLRAGALPADIRYVAVDGQISAVGRCENGSMLFIAQLDDAPTGPIGYVHIPCVVRSDGLAVGGFGGRIFPRIALGDGWWWADRIGR